MLFFSATMPRPIQDLIGRYTKDPAWVKIEAHAQNAPQVEQIYFEVDRRSKIEVLTRLIDLHDFRYGLIFCSTKIMVDELDEHLHARGYAVDRLHGDMSQAQRDRVMEKFRRRGFEFLVATDVAARGLDLDDLEVVFNFDLPNDAEDYIHRIGRTGRAGKTGRAFTFVSGRELYKLQNMVRFGQLKIRRERVPSLDQVEEARENVFFEKLRATLDAGTYRKQDRMIDRLLEQGYPSTDIAAALIHLLQGQGAPAEPTKAVMSADAPSWAVKKMTDPQPVIPSPPVPPVAVLESSLPKTVRPAPDREPAALAPSRKKSFERPPRTGREPGMTTLFFNVGRKHLVTQADIVGKIAGVTRLPAGVVGAIDLQLHHSLVDVATPHVELIVAKLAGIRLKGRVLCPAVAPTAAELGAE
jgi:ATP-dependent RNA helicase DeaD